MYQQQYGIGPGTVGGGASLGCTDVPKQIGAPHDRGQLEVIADAISNEIDNLGQTISLLEQRLSSVLQPEAPQPTTNQVGGNPPMPPISPAVGYLVTQRRRLEHLQTRIQSITSRLDT